MVVIDDRWLVSEWDAGQSYMVGWDPTNVVKTGNGSYSFTLDRAAAGDTRPYDGAEFQSLASATTGTWTWMAQAPQMVDGAVFGMFLYMEDYRTQPWREYDIEFVGENTNQIQLAVHFLDSAGKHVTLKMPSIIELGFDASKSMHLYGITLTTTGVSFTVDGVVVESFGASDVQGDVWDSGPMKSLTDLWVVPKEISEWAGNWVDPGRPLVAHVDALSLPSDSVFIGKAGADSLRGTSLVDQLYGNGGNDTLDGRAGADVAFGGSGNDSFWVDNLLDQTREYAGQGTDTVNASVNWTLAAHTERLALLGSAALSGTGNDLSNTLTGNAGANSLSGLGGNDTLTGGLGADTLTGGGGNDAFIFSKGDGDDVITDFRAGGSEDRLELKGYAGYSELRQVGADTRVMLSGTDSILLKNVSATALTSADFVFGLKVSTQKTAQGRDAAEIMKGSAGEDRIGGQGGNDQIYGKQSGDRMFGGTGQDWLLGGRGKDVMTGGKGDDTFRFNTGDGKDRITDFRAGGTADQIEIGGYKTYTAVQKGHDTLIVLSASDSILLTDVWAKHLTDADFLFL